MNSNPPNDPRAGSRSRQTDEKILDAIGRLPNPDAADIAKEADVPISTVRKRLKIFREKGLAMLKVASPIKAVISIDVDPDAMETFWKGQKEFCGHVKSKLIEEMVKKGAPGTIREVQIDRVFVTLGGRADIYAIVYAPDLNTLSDFVIRGLALQKGVRETNTATVPYLSPDEIMEFKDYLNRRGPHREN